MSRSAILVIFFAVAATACAEFTPDEQPDPIDECVTCDGRADTFGFDTDPYVAAGMLDVVNTVSLPTLDDEVGLYSHAAQNIMDARPIESLEALDAVPYVGGASFRRIAEFAELNGFVGFCGDSVVQSSVEECDDTTACSVHCETIQTLDITFGSVEVEGVLAAGERREYLVPAIEGDSLVIHLRKTTQDVWDRRLEIFRDGSRLEYSHPMDDADAHIPYRESELRGGFEIWETAHYTLVVENAGTTAGPFRLSIDCVAGDCAATSQPGADTDADGVEDSSDNCPFTPNADQRDEDADSEGDACDLESEFDRFPGLSGAQLEQALRAQNGWVTTDGYYAARHFMFTQLDNVAGDVSCAYTGWSMYVAGIPDHTIMNTEHLWPRSKGGPESDMHHLRPTQSHVNYNRSNHPFGEVSVEEWAEGGSALGVNGAGVQVFEPPHAVKGDIARSLFYVAVQYGRDLEASQESVLRTWHELDPPDAQERRRHQLIVNYQDSRNLFVDQPSLVGRIQDF